VVLALVMVVCCGQIKFVGAPRRRLDEGLEGVLVLALNQGQCVYVCMWMFWSRSWWL
jgi:coenzyme F420-reducing hydrogenase delta subunit